MHPHDAYTQNPPDGTGSGVTRGTTARAATDPSGVWVGTHPAAGIGTEPGRGEGVWWAPRTRPGSGGGPIGRPVLAAEVPAPSFLSADPDRAMLYAASEQSDGLVYALRVGRGRRAGAGTPGLEIVGVIGSGGSAPCHLALAPGGAALYVTNYSSATVAAIRLASDGTFGGGCTTSAHDVAGRGARGEPDQIFTHTGSGPDANRQEAPHPHSSTLAPEGRVLLVADLGTDQVWRYLIGDDGLLTPDGHAAALPPGSGPRHMTFSASGRWLLVTGELDCRLHVLEWLPGSRSAVLRHSVALAPGPRRGQPSHLVLRGSALYAAVRGLDVVAVLELDESDGGLRQVALLPAGAEHPRHFAVLDGEVPVLLVANQYPGELSVVIGDRITGHPVPSAACVLPAG